MPRGAISTSAAHAQSCRVLDGVAMAAHMLVTLHCTGFGTRGRRTARLSFLQSSLEAAGGPGAHTLSWTATAGGGRSTSGTYNMVRPRDV